MHEIGSSPFPENHSRRPRERVGVSDPDSRYNKKIRSGTLQLGKAASVRKPLCAVVDGPLDGCLQRDLVLVVLIQLALGFCLMIEHEDGE